MLRRSSRTSRTSKTSGPEQSVLTRRVSRDQVNDVFGPKVSPAITVSRGETIVVETQDCFRGLLTEKPQTQGDAGSSGGIPVSGPICVEEAHIGDVLSIQVKEIKTSDTGVFAVRSETGVPGQDIQNEDVRVLEVDENQVKLNDRLSLPVRPVIGNIGVATKHGEIETVYPGRHGGNMDTLEITTGSKVFLPVQVNGALLSLGDVKACLGEGQIAGSGVEVAAEVTIRVDTQPGGRFSWPRVESKGEWITITSASTVDQAARLAITEMVKWISQDKGLDYDTAYALVSLGGGLRVSQWGNPLITVRMVFPKRLINKLKSVPTASGRLNYRALPPAANGDTDGEVVAAEEKPSDSDSDFSSRSDSGRSKRSSGRSRQSGSRRGTRQRTNGAAAPAADDTIAQEEPVQQEETVLEPNGNDKDEVADQGGSNEKNSRASRDNGHGTRSGRSRRSRGSASKKATSAERVETQAVVAETSDNAGAVTETDNAPDGTNARTADKKFRGRRRRTSAARSAAKDAKPAADDAQKPAAKDAKPAADDAKPAAKDAKPAADDAQKSAADNAKPAADDAQKSAADNAKPAAKDAKPAADDAQKPAAKDAKPAAKDAKPAAKDAKPAADDVKPAADDAKPAADAQKPAGVSVAVTEPSPQAEISQGSLKEDSKNRSGSETDTPARKPAFGRRQRTVKRA